MDIERTSEAQRDFNVKIQDIEKDLRYPHISHIVDGVDGFTPDMLRAKAPTSEVGE